MISFNDQQKTKIDNLKPLANSKFKYNKLRWSDLNADFKIVIHDFEDKDITRQDVIDAYKNYFANNNIGFMKAFLLTMVWGFADAGYGTHRTNKYILTEANREKIKTALDFINENKQDSLKNAFNELTKIKGLGISYLSKILYFATKAKNRDKYALIFDIKVATALIKLTTPKEISEIMDISPSSKFINYQKYNSLIHKLALNNNVEPDQIEMYLFNQDFE